LDACTADSLRLIAIIIQSHVPRSYDVKL
jgi:hypothetical protein